MRAQARKRINTRAFVRLFNYLPRFTPYMIIQVYIFVYSYTYISISISISISYRVTANGLFGSQSRCSSHAMKCFIANLQFYTQLCWSAGRSVNY